MWRRGLRSPPERPLRNPSSFPRTEPLDRDLGAAILTNAPKHGPAVARGSGGAAGSTTRWTGSGSGRSGGRARPRSYPPCCHGGAAAPAVVHPLGPPAGEALGDRLSCRFVGRACRTPRRTIRPSAAFVRRGGRRAQRAVVYGTGGATGRTGPGADEGTLLDACLASQVRRPPLAAGRGAPSATDPEAASGAPAPTSATRCIWGWTRTGPGAPPRQRLRERGGRRLGERG